MESESGPEFGNSIIDLLHTVGVDSWEDLKGVVIRVARAEGKYSHITSIGHSIEDRWTDGSGI